MFSKDFLVNIIISILTRKKGKNFINSYFFEYLGMGMGFFEYLGLGFGFGYPTHTQTQIPQNTHLF